MRPRFHIYAIDTQGTGCTGWVLVPVQTYRTDPGLIRRSGVDRDPESRCAAPCRWSVVGDWLSVVGCRWLLVGMVGGWLVGMVGWLIEKVTRFQAVSAHGRRVCAGFSLSLSMSRGRRLGDDASGTMSRTWRAVAGAVAEGTAPDSPTGGQSPADAGSDLMLMGWPFSPDTWSGLDLHVRRCRIARAFYDAQGCGVSNFGTAWTGRTAGSSESGDLPKQDFRDSGISRIGAVRRWGLPDGAEPWSHADPDAGDWREWVGAGGGPVPS